MISPDGENVKMKDKVPCEYGVEKWLKNVEDRMRTTLKKILLECR